MKIHLAHIPLIALLLVLGTHTASAEIIRWRVDGQTREAIVYAPTASRGDKGVPLVLSFHGYGDNAQNFQHTGVHVAWPDAVVVYFQGLETRGGLPGWRVEPDNNNRDLKLVDVAKMDFTEKEPRPPVLEEVEAVQGLDVHALLAQQVGAIQALSAQLKAQASQIAALVEPNQEQAQETRGLKGSA